LAYCLFMMKIEQINGHSVVSKWIRPDSAVLDLGANVGAFSKLAHERFGCATCAVEPNEGLHKHLKNPAVRRLYGSLVTLDGRDVTFYLSENSECSSILQNDQSPVIGSKTLVSTRFEEILPRNVGSRTDWVKMDIEGVEIEILAGSDEETLLSIDQLSVEFHESNGLTDIQVVKDCINRMAALGFRVHRGSLKDYSDVLFINRRLELPLWWRFASLWWKFVNGFSRALRRFHMPGS
jgi:FkbM family methyltransferase